MNEALLNFMNRDIASERGRQFTLKVLDFMRDKMVGYQEETGNIYNLEATPAESTSYRLAQKDKEKYPDIVVAGEKAPYYTNSTQLPVYYQGNLFEALGLQDDLQIKYTGGTVFHAWLGEKIAEGAVCQKLIKRIFENFKLPYFTFTPTFSICSDHGYIEGEALECPQCGRKTEVYSRIVGYLRPLRQWNRGKQEEFRQREEFKVKN
jgi:ribonucleoside-triphosphate reductase